MADRSLLWSPAALLGQRVQRREVSAVELARWSLDELQTHGRELNAVATVTDELALAQAEQADREIAAGRIRGPLHGVPYGAKDLFATAGIPTRWGSPAHRDQVFDDDATVIERLREAGAVLVAKLAMVELAGAGGYRSAGASIDGHCRNPWDPQRWAGGSSSGSGAAVGGGLVPFALGSETWGSITVPAALCNVSGLRPTYGRVSRYGAMALSWTMDKVGPMARTAEDCGLVLAAIAGADPRDPSTAVAPLIPDSAGAHTGNLRLGVLAHDYAGKHAPEAQARFTAALDIFQGLGHAVAEATLPPFPYDEAAGLIIAVEGASAFEEVIRSERLQALADPAQQASLLAALAISGVDYLRAMRIRAAAGPAAVRIFDRFDALVAPTLLQVAPPVDADIEEGWTDVGGNGGFGNLLGWPSISIPMGPGRDGLPLGMEIIAAPYREQTILALATAFQGATDWHLQRPPV